MKRGNKLSVLLAGIVVLFLSSGCLYTNVHTPLDTDLQETELGDKIGKSHAYSVLWLVAWGDAGTAAAARDGGITQINHMDAEVFSVLFGLYTRTTTVVYGE